MITYTLSIFRLGTDISTNPQNIVKYITFKSKAMTMDALNKEIQNVLIINNYVGHRYHCKLQLRTANIK